MGLHRLEDRCPRSVAPRCDRTSRIEHRGSDGGRSGSFRASRAFLAALAACLLALAAGVASGGEPGGRKGGGGGGGAKDEGRDVFLTDIAPYPGNVILARPTDRTVTASVLLFKAARVRIEVSPRGGPAEKKAGPFDLQAGEPREFLLDGLAPDAAYAYRVLDAGTGAPLLPEGSFRTCRPPGSEFAFAVQADPHLDGGCLPELYRITLANELAGAPDFLIDLGDTFMAGKHPSRESAAKQYDAQRYYLGLVGGSAPVFLALGNHDGEETFRPGMSGASGLAPWSVARRRRFFPNPVPDRFYSGNADPHPAGGELQDYYAWTWGDALFVVLDPYWHSGSTRGGSEPWGATLGRKQYDWLAATLRGSKAKFKFVFIHQLTGGLDKSGRGGAEAATLYEWGGREKDGRDAFAERRPGWGKPVHAVLVETGVTAVFHGHDHFFANQEQDGVAYLLVPQPAHRNARTHPAEEYGYKKGDFLPNSGHLRVRVSPDGVQVEYVRSATPDMEGRGVRNGAVAFTVRLPVKR
jgi:hypothetical protein